MAFQLEKSNVVIDDQDFAAFNLDGEKSRSILIL